MKNKQLQFILISTIFLILTLPIVSSILIYLIEDLNFNIGLFKGSDIIEFVNLNTYINFFLKFNVFNCFGWVVIVWNIILQMFSSAEIKRRNKFEQNDKYGSHGTARFQNNKELLANYSQDKLGWFLGSEKNNLIYKLGMNSLYHKVNGDLNMQMTVVGPPGTNKTTGFIFPNIFHLVNEYKNKFNELGEMPDLIITDPKPEIIYSTYKFLKENNYNIIIYDFIFFKYGDKINLLNFIDEDNEEEDLINISDGYIRSIEASTSEGSGGDGFWTEQEGQAFGALLGAVKQTYKNPKIEDVLDLLTNKFTNSVTGALEVTKAKSYFDEKVKGASLQLWKNFLLICESSTTSANILGGLAGKLKLFAIKGIRNVTSESTFNIKEIGSKIGDFGKKQPTAVFVFMKPESRTYSPIINVVITTLFNQLYSTARYYNGRLPNPVYYILEEMANIGKLSGIQEKLGTMRGARIYPMMIWQSLAQMKDRYKDGWEDIIGQCDTVVYLGFNDDFTSEYCSKALGNTTIKIQGISSKNKGYGISDESESTNYTQRKLMFSEELRAMSRKEMIITQGGYNPLHINKVQYKHWMPENTICEKIGQNDLPLMKCKVAEDIKDKNETKIDNKIERIKEKDIEKNNLEHKYNDIEKEKEHNYNEEIEKDIERNESKEINYFNLNKEKHKER